MATKMLWCVHVPDLGPDVRRVAVEPRDDNPAAFGRDCYVPEIDRTLLKGVHLFDTEREARAALEDEMAQRTRAISSVEKVSMATARALAIDRANFIVALRPLLNAMLR